MGSTTSKNKRGTNAQAQDTTFNQGGKHHLIIHDAINHNADTNEQFELNHPGIQSLYNTFNTFMHERRRRIPDTMGPPNIASYRRESKRVINHIEEHTTDSEDGQPKYPIVINTTAR